MKQDFQEKYIVSTVNVLCNYLNIDLVCKIIDEYSKNDMSDDAKYTLVALYFNKFFNDKRRIKNG